MPVMYATVMYIKLIQYVTLQNISFLRVTLCLLIYYFHSSWPFYQKLTYNTPILGVHSTECYEATECDIVDETQKNVVLYSTTSTSHTVTFHALSQVKQVKRAS